MSGCPFHRMLRGLKVFAGLPVPATVKWIDGKPDFRQVDEEKLVRAVRFRLCVICDHKLGLSSFWVGGPRSQESHFFTDGAMHRECASESIRLCPFLIGTREHYRGDLPSNPLHNNDARPARMFLMRGMTDKMEWRSLGGGHAAIYAGDHLVTEREF